MAAKGAGDTADEDVEQNQRTDDGEMAGTVAFRTLVELWVHSSRMRIKVGVATRGIRISIQDINQRRWVEQKGFRQQSKGG